MREVPEGVARSATLATRDDVVAAVAHDPRLAIWKERGRGDGWLELELSGASGRGKSAVLVVLVWPEEWMDARRLAPHMVRARSGNYGLLLAGSDDDFVHGAVDRLSRDGDVAAVAMPASVPRLALALRARAESVAVRQVAAALELDLERAHHENELLISIGRALSQQREIHKLLEIILRRAREVTGADAGSVYILDKLELPVEQQVLKFMVSQNDSRQVESKGFTMPVSQSSIVGTCVLGRNEINISDLYALGEPGTPGNPWGFVHDRSFDDKLGYQTRSMLTVPMISARNQVIGVIQLINKRAKGFLDLTSAADFDVGVVPFDDASTAYATSLASQAGIALEKAMLYDEVTDLFEGFVQASVKAIEQRDPTTSGHSQRVADLTLGLAEAVDRTDSGRYREQTFRPDDLIQIKYAALLHDFGKVGVREHVLVKAKKLYEHQRELIAQRFAFIKRGFEVEGLRRKVDYLAAATREQVAAQLAAVDDQTVETVRELDELIGFILTANEPTVLEQGGFERIVDIAARRYRDGDGHLQPYLNDDEVKALQILRGSLTDAERDEINSHVQYTYWFLKEIPWGRAFRNVPDIAGDHHEKLDGSGYPRGRKGDEISVPTRMMTISDIYDALTARDRPYKKAIPAERALDIIGSEVKRGLLDTDLFDIFVGAKIWTRTAP